MGEHSAVGAAGDSDPPPTRSDGRRPVGRPRRLDDRAERRQLLDAGYRALRDEGPGFTIANILDLAGVSTRSFYRQFASKDALLCAMYRQDSDWVVRRIVDRLARADGARARVETWVDEVFAMVREPARAERTAVFGAAMASRAGVLAEEAARTRRQMVEPLRSAIGDGVADGLFHTSDPSGDADLIAAVTLHAAGLGPSTAATTEHDPAGVVSFALRALGHTG